MNLIENHIQAIETCRQMREALLADPYRPGYHFAIPEDNGMPGDPNGLFYANGRYHMFYLYCRYQGGAAWGHVSSIDLVHWRSHPDALTATGPGEGLCSGGAFVDEDGVAYIVYSSRRDGTTGCRIARSVDRHFDRWEDIGGFAIETPTFGIASLPDENGVVDYVGTQDPSNLWKKNGWYYMLTGNYFVVDKFRWDPDAPERYRGDWSDLFKSKDMKTWSFVHRFYQRDRSNTVTSPEEDAMCPCFLPLPDENGRETGKHILLFISHVCGAQYYTGSYDCSADRFIPETHGRFTSAQVTGYGKEGPAVSPGPIALTAPEAMIAPDGRLIAILWMPEMKPIETNRLWRASFSLPVELWLKKDGSLGVRPVRELQSLQYNEWDGGSFALSGEVRLPDHLNPVSGRYHIEADPLGASRIGLRVLALPDGSESVEVFYDAAAGQVCIDTRRCDSVSDDRVRRLETAPFVLAPGETLSMDVYVDHGVVDLFVNDRIMRARLTYPSAAHACSSVFSEGEASVRSLRFFEMMPSAMY